MFSRQLSVVLLMMTSRESKARLVGVLMEIQGESVWLTKKTFFPLIFCRSSLLRFFWHLWYLMQKIFYSFFNNLIHEDLKYIEYWIIPLDKLCGYQEFIFSLIVNIRNQGDPTFIEIMKARLTLESQSYELHWSDFFVISQLFENWQHRHVTLTISKKQLEVLKCL